MKEQALSFPYGNQTNQRCDSACAQTSFVRRSFFMHGGVTGNGERERGIWRSM